MNAKVQRISIRGDGNRERQMGATTFPITPFPKRSSLSENKPRLRGNISTSPRECTSRSFLPGSETGGTVSFSRAILRLYRKHRQSGETPRRSLLFSGQLPAGLLRGFNGDEGRVRPLNNRIHTRGKTKRNCVTVIGSLRNASAPSYTQ